MGDYLHVIHIAAITNLNTADSALQDVHDFNYNYAGVNGTLKHIPNSSLSVLHFHVVYKLD
ncbi:hypothetical protein CS542_01260 [Pedobacter sp. IW39]|nr:hypothetical protein CS542_01260 [Pedobacter sp. IW39]